MLMRQQHPLCVRFRHVWAIHGGGCDAGFGGGFGDGDGAGPAVQDSRLALADLIGPAGSCGSVGTAWFAGIGCLQTAVARYDWAGASDFVGIAGFVALSIHLVVARAGSCSSLQPRPLLEVVGSLSVPPVGETG